MNTNLLSGAANWTDDDGPQWSGFEESWQKFCILNILPVVIMTSIEEHDLELQIRTIFWFSKNKIVDELLQFIHFEALNFFKNRMLGKLRQEVFSPSGAIYTI